jgi:hypothetical protein
MTETEEEMNCVEQGLNIDQMTLYVTWTEKWKNPSS